MEENIVFAIFCHSSTFQSEHFVLLEYDTVEHLKIEIHKAFKIPPHQQVIDGWKKVPECDQTILKDCSNINCINYLTVDRLEREYPQGDSFRHDGINIEYEASNELNAVKSCFKKICNYIATSHITFHISTLKNAKDSWLLAPPQNRKAVLLYLHNSKDRFSNIFLRKLNDERISRILIENFFVMGWDVENSNYHSSLEEALKEIGLEHLTALVQSETCAAILIQNINNDMRVLSLLIDETAVGEEDTFLVCLKNSRDWLAVERKLSTRVDSTSVDNDIDSKKFQKLMADMLGDRDYDLFAFDQHEFLKQKIAYALYGQPQEDNGEYKEKERKQIDKIFEVLLKHGNLFAEYRDQVEVSFIYNVMEPLPKEKESKQKKDPQNYNPNTDITPVPIFVLRKCRDAEGVACRLFVDDIGRVYNGWENYIKYNKLPECIMVLPKNGRYEVVDNEVLLEQHDSPECSVLKTVLRGSDIASTVGGVGAGAVMVGATVVSAPILPVVAIGAGVVGAVSGIYSLVRSAVSLADRVKHDENCTLVNSEARGIYFNLLAGAMGFVGAGANMAVSQLAARGFNIGQGVGVAVNSIGVANIGVSGASIINSGYDVFDQWYNQNQVPSMLTIVQLSSSILFFGNAVYNFRTVQTIVDETQTKVLQDYQDSLRSNRHRKTFDKFTKETIRQNESNQVRGRAEIIKTIRNIPNKDEVFAVLTRSNKLMNKNGVRFFASGGDITLNGQTVNMNEFISMNKQQANAFLSNLPSKTTVTSSDANSMINDYSLNRWSLNNVESFGRYAVNLIGIFGSDVQGILMCIVKDVVNAALDFFSEIMEGLFPGNSGCFKIMHMVMEYFGGRAADYLQKYIKWRATGSPYYYNDDFVHVPVDNTSRYIWIFERVVRMCCNGGQLTEHEWLDMVKYLEGWILSKVYENQVNDEAKQRRDEHSPTSGVSNSCTVCGGHYFKN